MKTPNTVAERLYCRVGIRVTTFYYKHPDNTSQTLATAPTVRADKVALAKIQALRAWAELRGAQPQQDKTVAGLFERYFAWQAALPKTSTLRKADSTIKTNGWEQKPLLTFFGAMLPAAITAIHIYDYIDIRTASGSPAGCMKEVALLSAALEYGRRKGDLATNPCNGIKAQTTPPRTRTVLWSEIEFLTACGRTLGGSYHIQALAARAAWLGFKRPGEVLGLTKDRITEAGIVFAGNKRKRTQGQINITITWTPTLRETMDEALQLKRWSAFGGQRMVFGNLAGQKYSRSGWGAMWARLMRHCEAMAQEQGQPWQKFTLADCRPGGITSKKESHQDDVYDGGGHADRRMIDSIYDRRKERRASPAR